jgi:hypothetical protein
MSDWKAPSSVRMTLHNPERLMFGANGGVPGSLDICVINDGYQEFSLVIFTDNVDMATEISSAVNGILARYGRLSDRIEECAPLISPAPVTVEARDDH